MSILSFICIQAKWGHNGFSFINKALSVFVRYCLKTIMRKYKVCRWGKQILDLLQHLFDHVQTHITI